MSYTNDWSDGIPVDHTKFKSAPGAIRQVRIDVEQRLTNLLYGFAAGEVQTDEGIKVLPFRYQGSDPAPVANKILIYSKQTGSKAELFACDESGNIYQLTKKGYLLLSSGKLPNNTNLISRNAADNGDVSLIKANASDAIEIPNGAVLSSASAPSTDPMIPNKKYVDDQITAHAQVGFGAAVSKSEGTNYQAATDGIVTAFVSDNGDSQNTYYVRLLGYTDSNSTPSTLIMADGIVASEHLGSAGTLYAGFSFPVKKGNYYRVDRSTSGTGSSSSVINFTPLGS